MQWFHKSCVVLLCWFTTAVHSDMTFFSLDPGEHPGQLLEVPDGHAGESFQRCT